MILYLIRHGESAFNSEGRIQGQIDVPLSPLGVCQSQALAAALARETIDAVFSSPLLRAAETARPLADALQLPLQTDDRLMEINAGIFQGKKWSELADLFPSEAAAWAGQDPDYFIPQGESRRVLMLRGLAALEAIRAATFKQVAVVAHGGILSAALKALLEIPARRNPFNLMNASISKLAWDRDVKLLTLNQVEHLERLDGVLPTRGGDL